MMLLALIATLTANAPLTPDTARLAPVCRRFIALDAARIWPGFRPDTLAVAFVVPERGTMLCNWRGAPPEGFTALGAPGRDSGTARLPRRPRGLPRVRARQPP